MPRIATSIVPLAANQTWDSGPLLSGLADRITGSVFADQVGTIFIEQSGDNGNNWDIQTSYPIPANDGSGFSEEILLPWVRIRVVNGATNQGALRVFVRMTSAGSR